MTRVITSLLERMLDHRYRALSRALTEGVGAREARFRLGGRPNMSWHAAHLAAAIASTHEALFGAPPTGPCASADAPWPEARAATEAAASAMLDGLARTTDEELALPPQVEVLPAFRSSLDTRQRFLEGHLYHVAYHVGSIAVLRAELELDRGPEGPRRAVAVRD